MSGVFNAVVGANQAGPVLGTGETTMNFQGANLTPAAAASALTVGYPSGLANVLLTLGAPASGGTVGASIPGGTTIGGSLFYTLSGAAATAQIYWIAG